jgi:aminomethyltransferase
MVDFHGFELPIWYSSIAEEHRATRATAGLFDVSHMGSFRFSGPNVLQWLESISTQKVSQTQIGRCAYTHFLDHQGHIIDDMIFAVVSESEVLGVPNASMIPIMWQWFTDLLPDDGSVLLEDLSPNTSILALQGPNSPNICAEVFGQPNVPGRFKWQRFDDANGFEGWIQGTGYTGERGFEIFINNQQAPLLWRTLLEKGESHGLVPVGLGARDTLRLEKGYLLSGQDFLTTNLSDSDSNLPAGFLSRNSIETNAPFGLDMEHQFVGKEAMQNQDNEYKWWGIKYTERGPMPRPGKAIACKAEGDVIGYLTSGGPSPSLENLGIGMAYLKDVEEGDTVVVIASPRKSVQAIIFRPPFV